jgi:hypothetical protein
MKLFNERSESFRAFLRRNEDSGSACALNQSFLFDYNVRTVNPNSMKSTLAHETVHTLIGSWAGARWYDEAWRI